MKVACPVWSGGKGGDNFKTLPIAILFIHKDAECGGHRTDRGTEIFGYVCKVPVHGRIDRREGHHICNRYADQQQYDRIIYQYALSPV